VDVGILPNHLKSFVFFSLTLLYFFIYISALCFLIIIGIRADSLYLDYFSECDPRLRLICLTQLHLTHFPSLMDPIICFGKSV
jgi:hypothetical protein